jgi:hypothetical protein
MRLNLMEHMEELDAHVKILQKAFSDYEFFNNVAIIPMDDSVVRGVYSVMVPFQDRVRKNYGWLSVAPDGTVTEFDSLPEAENMR